jgi:transcriptional regulator of acetoin/glycerol metabolism
LRASLERHHGKIQEAAAALKISRHAFARLMKKHGIRRP